MPNAKEQLELLAAHQEEFELFLKELTGLTVKVSLQVYSSRNSDTDLLNIFEASLSMDDFKTHTNDDKTWIAHTDLNKSVYVHMPEDFNDSYPYPEDDEEYRLAVENANAHNILHTNIQEDNNPF